MTSRLPTLGLTGRTLIGGPSGAGKTLLTARTVERWILENGCWRTVIFDFAPEIKRHGRTLGGRLTNFIDVPQQVWYGVLEAHAPRWEGRSSADSWELARDNATRSALLVKAAPSAPRAVFANDVTIPFQHDVGDLESFLGYCEHAELVVLNAFTGTELGSGPISAQETTTIRRLRTWVDEQISLQ